MATDLPPPNGGDQHEVPASSASGSRYGGHQARDGKGRFIQVEESIERDAEAMRLRSRGKTLRFISDKLGYGGESNVLAAISRHYKSIVAEPAQEIIRGQTELLDHLTDQAVQVLERHHVTISGGRIVYDGPEPTEDEEDTRSPLFDDGPVLQAIATLLRVQERRSKLLGLDAPQRVDATVHQPDPAELELAELIREQRAKNAVEAQHLEDRP